MNDSNSWENVKSNLWYVLLGLVASYIFLLFAQVYHQVDLFPINKHHLGIDFSDFYHGALDFRNGTSLYLADVFVTPPTPVLFVLPLTDFSIDVATRIFFFVTIISVLLAIVLSWKSFSNGPITGFVLLACIVFLSHPFLFLLDRGNIDGLVLLFLALGLFFLKRDHQLISGFSFGLAIALKVYPVLLVIPLIINRKWRSLAGCFAMLLLMFLFLPNGWMDFFQERLLADGTSSRFSSFRLYENGSLANFFYYCASVLQSIFHPNKELHEIFVFRFSTIAYILLFFSLVFYHLKAFLSGSLKGENTIIEILVLYIPFMVAVPKLAYLYEYVVLIPLYLVLAGNAKINANLKLRGMMIAALVAINVNTIVIAKIFQTINFHFIPSLGLFTLMLLSIYVMRDTGLKLSNQ